MQSLCPILRKLLLVACCLLLPYWTHAQAETQTDQHSENGTATFTQPNSPERVFVIPLKAPIDKASWHLLSKGLSEAKERLANLIVLDLNTYGGEVEMADSMRTALLNSPIPVWAFIDNQAASAGALISLACDSIYMREGASIGAATVVNGTDGQAMPDKYQSFMRSMMRSTAQAKGKKRVSDGQGGYTLIYRRDPRICEAMVDPSIAIPGIIDSTHVLTLTAHEAHKIGLCEGIEESVRGILARNRMGNARVEVFEPSGVDSFSSFLLSPFVSGFLIMLIIGGIYFELQTPGVGFPLLLAIGAAIAYFAPLYIEGLLQYIDVIIFLAGVILLLLEAFVIPGFGIAGILGMLAVIVGLSLSLVDNSFVFSFPHSGGITRMLIALATVMIAVVLTIVVCIALSGWLLTNPRIPALALRRSMNVEDGYVGLDVPESALLGQEGTAITVLRPAGKVVIEGKTYDAISQLSFIEKGQTVRVINIEGAQIYVAAV